MTNPLGKRGACSGSERKPATRLASRFPFPASRVLAAVLLLALSGTSGCLNPGKGKTAYVGATVIDGTGAPPILDGVIIVADGRIERIGSPDLVKVPRGALELRLDGRWVIPGLIDAHVHLERWALSRYLAYGVTSVRSMGGDRDSVIALRNAILLGSENGPRLYVSGPMVDGRPATWPGATEVRNANQARRAVDDRVLLEATQVKVYTKINRRLLEPLLAEAGDLNIPVAAHLGRVDAVTAAQLGVHSIEHLTGVVESTLPDPSRLYRAHNDFFTGWRLSGRSWSALDSAALDRTATALVATDVAVVPTLVLYEAFGHLADQDFIAQLDFAGVPTAAREAWDVPDLIRRAGMRSADFAAFRTSRSAQDRFLRIFLRAGGTVAAGSDSPNQLLPPGASLHRELELLVAAGLTAEEALLAATREAARVLDSDTLGVLMPGAVADFLVLSADPLDDITNTRLIERLVLRGESYHPDEFKTDWDNVQATADSLDQGQ